MAKTKATINPTNWVDDHGDYLLNYAIARVFSPETAKDLIQDTFVAALKAQSKFRGDSSERTWLISILKRKIIDYYRKKSTTKEDKEILARLENTGFESPFRTEEPYKGHWQSNSVPKNWFEDNGPDMQSDEFKRILQQCLSKLPKKWAGVFSRKIMDEESNHEICKEFDISTSNLWVILHRSRLQLRECVEKNWFD